jgi:hypothetical protein
MHSSTLKFACTFLALFSILILGMPALTGTLHAQGATGGVAGGGGTTPTTPPPDPTPSCNDLPAYFDSVDALGNGCGHYFDGCGRNIGFTSCGCTQQPTVATCGGGTSCIGYKDPSTGCAYVGGLVDIGCTWIDCMGNTQANSYNSCQPDPTCVAANTPPPPPPVVLVNGVDQFAGFFTVPGVTGSGKSATVTIQVTTTTATTINFNDPGVPTTPASGALIIAKGQSFSGQYLDPNTGLNTSNIAGLTAINRSGISFVMKQTVADRTRNIAPAIDPNGKNAGDSPGDGPDVALYALNGNGQLNYTFDVTVFQDTKFGIVGFPALLPDGSMAPRPPADVTMTITPLALKITSLVPTGTITIPPPPSGSYQPGAIVPIDWSINYN